MPTTASTTRMTEHTKRENRTTVVLSARVPKPEAEVVREAAAAAGMSPALWQRRVLLAAAEQQVGRRMTA